MAKKSRRQQEEELRKKFQDQLHSRFEEQKRSSRNPSQKASGQSGQDLIAELEELQLRQYLEQQVYGQYPEFICCENHLEEVRWLTPAELEEDFEFYPREESGFARFKKRFFGHPKMPQLSTTALKEQVEAIRSELQADAQKRREAYLEHKKAHARDKSREREEKIYQEELDKFYSRKKGYKKYINHLNETKWLSREEFINQDEFTEEVRTPAQIWIRRILYSLGVALLAGVIWLLTWLGNGEQSERGWVVVDSDSVAGQLYVDQVLAVGFSPGVAYPVVAGNHQISFIREGYAVEPPARPVELVAGDTLQLTFKLQKKNIGASGLLLIEAPYPDAGILLNGQFRGTLSNISSLRLEAGDYTLVLDKPGYRCLPPQRPFSMRDGDTLTLSFRFRPLKSAASQKTVSRVESGLLEVRTNVKGADIYLDGQKTNFQTDYVLQQIPLGTHLVRVAKKGYKVYPEEQQVRVTEADKQSSVSFTLSSTVRRVTLKTAPVAGDIFVDDKRVGNGEVTVPLPLGMHKINFSEETYYKKPQLQEFEVTSEGEAVFTFTYEVNYRLNFSVGLAPDKADLGSMNMGYLLNDDEFRQSNQAGPEVKRSEQLGADVWMLGYAFQYRNPPGRDAMVFNFLVPPVLDLSQPLYLKVWAYSTSDLYPLKLRGETHYKIDVNQFHLRSRITPRYSEEQASADKFEKIRINEMLHPGFNRILITTTPATTAHLMLWKLAIE